MREFGLAANLMSLGGIAIGIGILGDGAIVMVENNFRQLNVDAKDTAREKVQIVLEAAREVSRPIVFSIVIIVTVFLPIFALQDVEGKMFSPMAATLCFALAGSLVVAIAVAPALCTYLLKGHRYREFKLVSGLMRIYHPPLRWTLRHRPLAGVLALAAFVVSVAAVPHLGTEFVPTLEEGSIQIDVTLAPSISLDEAVATVQTLERKVVAFAEVEEVVSRIGRPRPEAIHTRSICRNARLVEARNQWTRFANKKELVTAMNEA
jgi:cobalt-zinc-cadmium resistance protein CzcA